MLRGIMALFKTVESEMWKHNSKRVIRYLHMLWFDFSNHPAGHFTKVAIVVISTLIVMSYLWANSEAGDYEYKRVVYFKKLYSDQIPELEPKIKEFIADEVLTNGEYSILSSMVEEVQETEREQKRKETRKEILKEIKN